MVKEYKNIKVSMIPLLVTLSAAIFIAACQNIPIVYAAPRIYLDPSNNAYTTTTVYVGYRFNVTVWVEDSPDIGAFQVHLRFNDTILNVTRWFEPKWDAQYIFSGKTTSALPSPPDPGYVHLGPGLARVQVGANLFPTPPTQPPSSGTGKLCIFEFNITALPSPDETLSCTLNINTTDTYLLSPAGLKVSGVIKENGNYQLQWTGAPPPTPPNLAVDPSDVKFSPYVTAVNKFFAISIFVKDLDPSWSLTNVTLHLNYNATIFDVIGDELNVTWNYLWQNHVVTFTRDANPATQDYVSLSVANPSATPSGNTLIATLNFTVVYQGLSPPRPLGDKDTSELTLSDYHLFSGLTEISVGEIQNGLVTVYALRTASAQLTISQPKILNATYTEIRPNVIFDVNVTISEAVDLRSFKVKILYNSTILNCTSASAPADNIFGIYATSVVAEINNTAGYVIFNVALPSHVSSFTGSGVMFHAIFKGLNIGESYLNFSKPYGDETFLYDSTGTLVTADLVEKQIQVVPEFPLILTLPLLMIITLIVIALRRKLINKSIIYKRN
jgi:hypothetical protein